MARGGHTRGGVFRITAPGRESGVYLFDVRTRARHVTVPFAVQGAEKRPVLVVLPTMTWQGRNPVDDDGDGLPNLLDRGLPVRLGRVLAGDGLPVGFAQRDAPLLAWLARSGRRFDVTTDVALAAGSGPKLADHKGVLLTSDTRWLPRGLQRRLRSFVRGGGTVASLGLDSLRRGVRVTPRGRLIDPTPPAPTDLFGARLGPLTRAPAPVTLTEATDRIELFAGTDGQFPGWDVLEPLAGDRRPGAAGVVGGDRGRARADHRGALRQGPRPPLRAAGAADEADARRDRSHDGADGAHMDAPVPLIVVALLAAAALVVPSSRWRAAAMLGALAIAPVILVFHISSTDQFRR